MPQFSKLLIANRGEIAIRVMRSAQAMGIGTVAVYSEADTDAEHVRAADEAVCIGGAAPADSYLRIDRIIEAAQTSGADAIHPGYGFLSENPALPDACSDAGLVFVGPSAPAISKMGDKAEAKRLMEAAGVPCVPGYAGDDQSPDALRQEAMRIGFPLMIKATAGGGGRGMRLVETQDDFAESLASAVSEAESAFGDGTVLLERAILSPRHVEIQIMADAHGNAIHLGERDCSVQRRHQKVIEEAPSPAVDPALRRRMGDISVKAAQSIGYQGAGTFEYLLDSDGHFYFMEMNTRLQVEHPVTEAITGLDLVALQLTIARGVPLPITQEDVSFSGHAIEVRLCAEDPQAGFLPQSGRMARWHPARTLRTDHALRDGATVPPYYDSMMAKLIAHGPDRATALQRLHSGVRNTLAFGIRTNLDFLGDCLKHETFAAGQATTGFIEEHHDALLGNVGDMESRAVAMVAAILRGGENTGLAHAFPTPLRLKRGQTLHTPLVRAHGHGRCHVSLNGIETDVVIRSRKGYEILYSTGGQEGIATLQRVDDQIWLHLEGRTWDFTDLSLVPEISREAVRDGKLRASMNGTVVSVAVSRGDRVEAGETLMVLEAMKMEHAHVTSVSGTVSAVHVTPGAQLAAHTVAIEVEPG